MGAVKENTYLKWIKRPFDLFLSLFGLIIFSPIFLTVAAIILFKEGQPVIFRQERVGRNGNIFQVFKFRTMKTSNDQNNITVSGDPRITPLGSLLRRYKLDELPQLWNVFKGDMSFVGPRPDVPGYMDRLTGRDSVLLTLRPGITSPATLAFRNEEKLLAKAKDPKKYNDEFVFPEKVRLNMGYLEKASLSYDLKLILITVFNRRWDPNE